MMSAKDVPDKLLLSWIEENGTGELGWTIWWEFPEDHPEYPEKVCRAKFKQLYRRGLVEGCSCGCRGDWVLTDKGLEYLRTLNDIHQIRQR